MQPGAKSRQLERARNELDLGVLGDPERWGGTGKIVLTASANPAEAYSPQIIRVQCGNLVARSWDLFCGWRIDGVANNDAFQRQGLEITLGIGQSSWVAVLDLRSTVLGIVPLAGPPTILQPAVFWEFTPGNQGIAAGAVSLPVSLPAVAIAARAVLAIQGDPAMGPHQITANFFVGVSPRAIA